MPAGCPQRRAGNKPVSSPPGKDYFLGRCILDMLKFAAFGIDPVGHAAAVETLPPKDTFFRQIPSGPFTRKAASSPA
jgi:hypothetical protein